MQVLTPKQIVSELDKYIIGQADAKRAVAVAIRNRWRRMQLKDDDLKNATSGKNIIMIGPTGVGKTEIARRLATLTGAPFVKVEATKFTEVGYHGRDVDSMIRDLLDSAIAMVREEMNQSVQEPASAQVEERLLDLMLPGESSGGYEDEEAKAKRRRTREKLRDQLQAGELEERQIEIQTEQKTTVGVLGPVGMEMDVEFQSMLEKMMPSRRETRKLPVSEARKVLLIQESDKLVDREKINRLAIDRVEQSGIVFLDEIDKICGTDSSHGPDVSRQGVQRDLLPIVEGSAVITKYGAVKTDHILFIAAGAFHSSKPSDLMPELQGRFPIRVELADLTKEDFVRILHEPRHSLTKQQVELLATEGLTVEFTEDAIETMAGLAFDLNRRTQNIGARRLYTIIERVVEGISFEAPDLPEKKIVIDSTYVTERLAGVIKDEDLSRFIL
jgi:ATP-dependent HslUV protease ATP-binding subunit HslU